MKKYILPFAIMVLSLFSLPSYSQSVADSTLLGLPGDNLDLYAVLDIFQKSKTIEEFEKTLNLEKTGVNNMDLNLDKKVDFIKVTTMKSDDKDNFTFVLQIDVSKTETQDVAVILVSRDAQKKVSIQIVGDEELYGKNYIVDLKESSTPAVTANPGYQGSDTVEVVSAPAKTTTVVVEQAPIVQYVYSSAYVPYYPPYYYNYYPPYFAAFTVMAIGMYWGFHAHYHHHGGYYGNTTIIHNSNNFNNYNRTRNTSNTVRNNNRNGSYKRNNSAATRPATRQSGRTSNRPSASTRPSTSNRPSASTRPSTSNRPSASTRQSSSNGASRFSSGASRGRSSSSFSSGGGYRGGGGFRGGGGRRR